VPVSEIASTSAEEFTLALEQALWPANTAADIRIVLVQAGTATLEEARERVLRADIKERLATSRDFAIRVAELGYVKELWVDDREGQAVVTAIVEGASLEDELHLEAVFTAIVQAHPSFDGHLRVYALEDELPEFAREGQQLLP